MKPYTQAARRLIHHYWYNGNAVMRAQWYLRDADRVGRKSRVWGSPEIRNAGTLLVGERVRLFSTIATLEIDVHEGARLEIGDGTSINYGTSIGATSYVRIGKDCLIGTHSLIMDNDFHGLDPERRNERPASAPVVLEDNVWLGAKVTVLRGVTIGAGSVIAAGSLVTRDVPARVLAVGVPARPVQKL